MIHSPFKLFFLTVLCMMLWIPCETVFSQPLDSLLTLKTLKDSVTIDSSFTQKTSIPYRGKVISKFGPRGRRFHCGTDIKLAKGDTVYCAFDGVVKMAKTSYGYGLLVKVQHKDQVETYYSHLSKILVTTGQTIQAGTPVGLGGQTGRATTTHLHFELRFKGIALNAQTIFDFENNKLIASSIAHPAKPRKKSLMDGTDLMEEVHKVQKGDTLYAIAKRYGVSIDDLCRLNNIKSTSVLSIGQVLHLK